MQKEWAVMAQQGCKMRTTLELYRVPKSYFDRLESKEKVRLAKEHIDLLFEEPLERRDLNLINELLKAIEHHEFLINEE